MPEPRAGVVVGDSGWDADVARAHTPMGRAIMRVLSERGHYGETPDDFEWALADAGVTVRYIEERGYTFRNVYDALLDTGVHGEPCQCLQADVDAIGAAL